MEWVKKQAKNCAYSMLLFEEGRDEWRKKRWLRKRDRKKEKKEN